MERNEVVERLRSRIADVPDFPVEGVLFRDITPVLADPRLIQGIVDFLTERYRDYELDAVAGIESRGFFFGIQLARALHIPFIPIRKEGKLPREKVRVAYQLEYGEAAMEAHADAIEEGWRVLIHDDLLATGGTAEAAAGLMELLKGEIAAFSFLVELDFLKGRERITRFSRDIEHITSY